MNGRKQKRMVHVSFDLVDRFVPRVPGQRCVTEDDHTPRICVAPDLLSALQAIPQAGEVIYTMKRIGLPVIIHAYYLKSDSVKDYMDIDVPDAGATGEMWIMDKPDSVYRADYELIDSYTVPRRDRYGTIERFLLSAVFKRTRYQDNWRNFADVTGKSKRAADWFMEHLPKLSFRTFISNLDDELLKHAKINIREVADD